MFVNGDYYWVPFETISEIKLDAPVDLRDLVWVPAHLKLVNEGLHPVLLPARYPLLQANAEDALLQSRLTRWSALGKDDWQGSGVKILATDTDEASSSTHATSGWTRVPCHEPRNGRPASTAWQCGPAAAHLARPPDRPCTGALP